MARPVGKPKRPTRGDPGEDIALRSAQVRIGRLLLPDTALNEVRFELVSLTAQSRDLGTFLRSLEFKSLLHKTPARLNLDLGWPGAPDRLFSAAALKGRIRFDLEAGSLLGVEPEIGRVLGIFNLNALRQRGVAQVEGSVDQPTLAVAIPLQPQRDTEIPIGALDTQRLLRG